MENWMADTAEGFVSLNDGNYDVLMAELSAIGLRADDIEFIVYDADTGAIVHLIERYKPEFRPQKQERLEGILFNPKQRFFFNQTPDELRPVLERIDWLNLPYVMHYERRISKGFPNGTYELLVLDGGVHDGPSSKGLFPSLVAAAAYCEGVRSGAITGPLARGRLCNVGNCGDGECVHSWSGKACPHCDYEMIFVSGNDVLCCSNPDHNHCDYSEYVK
jgi:hypothetical protein